MVNIGFNPMPNISLGDMESIFDIENEIAIMAGEDSVESSLNAVKTISKIDIINQFKLPDKSVQSNSKLRVKESKLAFDVEEQIETNGHKNDEHVDIHAKEIKIKENNRLAEEQKRVELEAAERIRKLKAEAEQAEREALIARQKREAEQRRIDEENRLHELRMAEQRRKEEELRLEQQKLERQRLEEQRKIEQLKLEQLKIEQERIERERREQLRIEQERLDIQRREQLRIEQERINMLKLEQERVEAERKAKVDEEERQRKEKLKQVLAAKKRKEQLEAAKAKELKIKEEQEKAAKLRAEQAKANQYQKYDDLDTDALYGEVRKFLKEHNVEKKIIDARILEDKFGKANIKKLLLKSYLISIGKGVTVGR